MPAAKEETAEKNKSLAQLKQGPISGIIMLYYKLMHFPYMFRLLWFKCGRRAQIAPRECAMGIVLLQLLFRALKFICHIT